MDQSFNEHDKEVMTRLAASRQELKKTPIGHFIILRQRKGR